MKNRRIDPNGERWREIPGFNGRYQASDEGRARKINQDGSALVLKPFIHIPGKPCNKIQKPYVVRLIRPDGRKCERSVLGGWWRRHGLRCRPAWWPTTKTALPQKTPFGT